MESSNLIPPEVFGLERAWERFNSSFTMHIAALHALQLLQTLPDPAEQLAVSFKVLLKADPKYEAWLSVGSKLDLHSEINSQLLDRNRLMKLPGER